MLIDYIIYHVKIVNKLLLELICCTNVYHIPSTKEVVKLFFPSINRFNHKLWCISQ